MSNDYLAQGLLNATFEAATLYVRTSILANGGAAVAWLAYIGVVGRENASAQPVIWFAIGVLLPWIASYLNYLGQRANWEWLRQGLPKEHALRKRCDTLIQMAVLLSLLSPIAFIIGGSVAYVAL